MTTFSASLINLTALLPQSHDCSCYVSRRILRTSARNYHYTLRNIPEKRGSNFHFSSFGHRHGTIQVYSICNTTPKRCKAHELKQRIGNISLHSNTTARNDDYKTEILYFVLKMTQFKKFGACSSVIRGTRHPYSPIKRHIKFTTIYNDYFLNRGATKPYLKFNKDRKFPPSNKATECKRFR